MISQSAKDFISACLKKNQENRSTASELEIQIRESWTPSDDDTHSPHNKSRRISLNSSTTNETCRMRTKSQLARCSYSANQGACALNRVKRISDEKLPPIEQCLDDSLNICFNSSIQHFRDNMNNIKNCSKHSTSKSKLSSENNSKARRSSIIPNKRRIITDIILPQTSTEMIIRKEDLFNCSSTLSSSQATPPTSIPPDMSDQTNMTNEPDSPTSDFDCTSTNVVQDDERPKNSFSEFFSRSRTSHKLPPLHGQMNLNENIATLFVPENLKVCNFDKPSGMSRIPARNNLVWSSTLPADFTRRSRSTSPQKFMMNQQNSEVKVTSWLQDNDKNGLAYRQKFRNSNVIESKDLAKSF